jgi:hypothetical protein
MLGRKSVLRNSSFVQAAVKSHGLEFAVIAFEEIDSGNYVNFVCEVL